MRWILLLLVACHADVRHTTHAFVATERCGQGPYDVHLRADGKMGSEGVEVVACSAHRISGHVELIANHIPAGHVTFGDGADNGRCVGGGAVVTTAGVTTGTSGATGAPGGPGAHGATPVLAEQPYTWDDAISDDELCAPYHLPGQTLMIDHMVTTDLLTPDADIDVRIWSDVPNDLEGVVFLVRHAISTHTRAEEAKEDAEEAAKLAKQPQPPPAPPVRDRSGDHGAPPQPLSEARPPRPDGAVWVPGYWSWLGTQWGWSSGFWRAGAVEMPAPEVEVPGQPPVPAAIWMAGMWQLRAGSWIWIGGRWRR